MATPTRPTLDDHVANDGRALHVYLKARAEYNEHRLAHHDFLHILRDMHRALVIADTEPSVDYGILIPAVLLHDIGFFTPDCKDLGHDVTGARLAAEWLSDFGYSSAQIDAIGHCIRAHKGKAETPWSLEAKILYDADVLEKAGAVYLILAGKVICEFDETIAHCLAREVVDRAREVSHGYYTRMGQKLDNGRLERSRVLLDEVHAEIQSERFDIQLDETALWAGGPPE
ncbi:MAG: HD domain-containing protein [Acidobacteria bacterium]|nr:HD domain-containing protein [Acidobacteriota bacterium]